MALGIVSDDMIERLLDVITMKLLDRVTLPLPGTIKQARNIHILPKMRTDVLISLGVLCDDGLTITLYQQ